jgi:hypothetical protein
MLTTEQFDEIVSAALQEGLDDWVSVADLNAIAGFYGVASSRGPSKIMVVPDWAIEQPVREIVGRGWARIGDVYTRGYFVPFDGDDASAIEWFVGVFREEKETWVFDAYLALTPAGEEYARTLPRARYLDGPDGMGGA